MSRHTRIIEFYRRYHHDLIISVLVMLPLVFSVLVTRLGWMLLFRRIART